MGDGGARDGGEEEVVEFGADGGGGAGGGEDGERSGGVLGVGAEVVEAGEVVGMVVGEENAVQGGDAVEEALGTEVGGRVEKEAGGGGLEENGGTKAAVAGIGGRADGTITGEHGNSVGGSRAKEEKGERRHFGG